MSEITTVARSSTNAVRSHGFPVLETGNLSFPEGRYAVEFVPGRDRSSFTLKHRIYGAPLITRLLREDIATYVCAVSSPMSSYRRIHRSSEPVQQIAWDTNDLGEPPLFTPMIICVVEYERQLNQKEDGVHKVWHGQELKFARGSRLAVGPVIQLRSSILQLLSFHQNPNLKDGRFFVVAETEGGFRFRVELNPRLHTFLKYTDKDGSRESIMTHIVSACLALLQREFAKEMDGEWKSDRNLLALADFLERRALPHWGDDEFRPEEVATSLYPHTVSKREVSEET